MVQPDIVKMGGITGMLRCAALTQAHGAEFVPHQTQPTIGTTCNMHFASCFDNSSRAQEYNHNPEKSKLLWGIFKKSFEPQNGYMQVPDGPGLGLELDEAAMKRLVAA